MTNKRQSDPNRELSPGVAFTVLIAFILALIAYGLTMGGGSEQQEYSPHSASGPREKTP